MIQVIFVLKFGHIANARNDPRSVPPLKGARGMNWYN